LGDFFTNSSGHPACGETVTSRKKAAKSKTIVVIELKGPAEKVVWREKKHF
jgi:hypothetical protein